MASSLLRHLPNGIDVFETYSATPVHFGMSEDALCGVLLTKNQIRCVKLGQLSKQAERKLEIVYPN